MSIELEATSFGDGRWIVRPKGALGTVGWTPVPWQAVCVSAQTAEAAIAAARLLGSVTRHIHHFDEDGHCSCGEAM